MISDSIPNASIAMASSNPKDVPKKKRANRSAKLKQSKLDARREQWLSQVKNKNECKEEMHGGGDSSRGTMHSKNEQGMSINKLEIKPRGEKEIYEDGSPMHHYSDIEYFPSNSPTSHTSSALCSHDSGINFTASSRGSSSSSGRSSSSSSNCFCSGSVCGEDEENVGEDDCLDDWEALADALAVTDNNQQNHSPSSKNHGSSAQQSNTSNGNLEHRGTSNKAWTPDDAFRPVGLPNLTKQYSFPLNSERHFGRGVSVWGSKNGGPVTIPCPICCENFDYMDSIFHPCPCGFRLCLFCHKRICEEDGRCPGCRKQYGCNSVEEKATVRFARSYSMIPRS